MVTAFDEKEVTEILSLVKDPEIPVLTVEDMGIIRRLEEAEGRLKVVITPTYSGCPAMEVIEKDISDILTLHGIRDFDVVTEVFPAWTSDWISEEGRQKLADFGIAPPAGRAGEGGIASRAVICPQCGSEDTTLISEFGSTACKAQYRCRDCLEPFDYFKCV
ncbi:MAG: phenylacetate-CoA oxygenase subunit PaaJ [Alphaproteobacteria bacterium]|nr:MAG: phenylacetate-CoA oxygenase subunit PaaJ [Alphaproteobacteria bacterium]